MCIAVRILEQLSPKARNANPLVVEPEADFFTQNGHSRSFKVIYFGVTEEPLRQYIAQYNNCRLTCESLEAAAGEICENRRFRRTHSHLMLPIQRTPANLRISLILLETAIFGLHFCR